MDGPQLELAVGIQDGIERLVIRKGTKEKTGDSSDDQAGKTGPIDQAKEKDALQ